LSTESFDALVVDQEGDAGEGKDWLLHFVTDWCDLCNSVQDSLVEATEHLGGPEMVSNHTNFAIIDCGRYSAVCSKFKIKTYPQIVFVRGNAQRSVYNYRGDRQEPLEIADFVRRRGEGLGNVSGWPRSCRQWRRFLLDAHYHTCCRCHGAQPTQEIPHSHLARQPHAPFFRLFDCATLLPR
jgi:hypothetical protein